MTFGEGSLGILIHKRNDVDQGAVVTGFKKLEDGSIGPAEACGKISPGQILIAINGTSTLTKSFKKTIQDFVKAPRPITLTLRKHPDFTVVVKQKDTDRIASEPLGVRLASLDGMLLVTGFEQLQGQAQRSGKLHTGMAVVSVAGTRVTGNNIATLIKAAPRPVTMSFADPHGEPDAAVAVVTFEKGPIGLLFNKSADPTTGLVTIAGFSKAKAPLERNGQVLVGHVLTHVEGEPVGDSLELAAQLIAKALDASGAEKGKRKVSLTFRDMDLYLELFPASSSPRRAATAATAAAAATALGVGGGGPAE